MTRWASVRCVKSRRVVTSGASGRSAGPRCAHHAPIGRGWQAGAKPSSVSV
jgi:hypothetical protein